MIRRYFTLLSFLLGVVWVIGQTPADRMHAANEAFQSKQYQSAVDLYQALYEEGYASAILHYNLGNSYYRLGRLGLAILNYERALLYQPHDRDIRHNLTVARQQLADDLDILPEFFLKRWWRNLAFVFPTTLWTVLGLLSLWLGFAGMVIWLFAGQRRQKIRGFVAGLILLVLCILPFALASSRLDMQRHSGRAILLAPQVALRNAPDAQSTEVLTIHEGLRVELLDRISGWYKVRLQNGEEGWLPQDVLEEI